jgi:hypothetical protein
MCIDWSMVKDGFELSGYYNGMNFSYISLSLDLCLNSTANYSSFDVNFSVRNDRVNTDKYGVWQRFHNVLGRIAGPNQL